MSKTFGRNDVVTEYAQVLIRVKAKQLVRRPGFCRSDQDDIEQELVLYLLSQAQHFDPNRASLNTFIDRVVNSAAAMLVRERSRIKRRPTGDVEVQSLEERVEQPDGPPEPLWMLISVADLARRTGVDRPSDAEMFELLEGVASAIGSLPQELQDVCRSLLEHNRAETECELELSRRRLDVAMKRIRQHFLQAGLAKN